MLDYTPHMDKKAFKEILERYLNNSCTPEEAAFVDEWFSRIGKRDQLFMSDEDEVRLFERYDVDLQDEIRRREARNLQFNSGRRVWFKVAASVLVVVGIALYFYQYRSDIFIDPVPVSATDAGIREVVNDGLSAHSLFLSDGSEVVLNPDSRVAFRYPFDEGIREVVLEGEAFFDVMPDPNSPFIVRTDELMTKVLGTSFTVKANRNDDNIFVTVKTGKVSVKGSPSETEEVVSPNEQIIYNIPKRSMSRKEVRVPVIEDLIGHNPERIRFKEAPITEILRAMETIYTIEIVFDEANFNGCLLSTSISVEEELFSKLDIICKAIGATYKVDGISVVVSGTLCKQIE